ncbi:MAG: putative Fumarylacetoacetate hydrolase [Modestobacter sp.]|nr:putative Fumarylacetoacetate hydrolase [Modestobacter sp.]
MQLVTYHRVDGAASARVGILDGELVVDLADAAQDRLSPDLVPDSMLSLLRMGQEGMDLARAGQELARSTGDFTAPLAEVRLAAPLPRPNSMRDFMLVEEHVKNSFGTVPDQWYRLPIHWKGNPDTVIGPDDEVPWPHYTDKLDYELEVAAVLGRPAYQVTPDQALECIVGYTIFNDWSARDIQFREMEVRLGPAFGKDFATSLGPVLTTADAIDISTARMSARVNGETWSEGGLGAMVFSFAEAISTLSVDQPLQPGDVFGGGTIGRGCGLELDRWISPGDVVELEVEGIGVLRNRIGRKRKAPGYGIDLLRAAD